MPLSLEPGHIPEEITFGGGTVVTAITANLADRGPHRYELTTSGYGSPRLWYTTNLGNPIWGSGGHAVAPRAVNP